jgi:hypothetical protein
MSFWTGEGEGGKHVPYAEFKKEIRVVKCRPANILIPKIKSDKKH